MKTSKITALTASALLLAAGAAFAQTPGNVPGNTNSSASSNMDSTAPNNPTTGAKTHKQKVKHTSKAKPASTGSSGTDNSTTSPEGTRPGT